VIFIQSSSRKFKANITDTTPTAICKLTPQSDHLRSGAICSGSMCPNPANRSNAHPIVTHLFSPFRSSFGAEEGSLLLFLIAIPPILTPPPLVFKPEYTNNYMEGSRLAPDLPPGPTPGEPINLRPLIFLIILILAVWVSWTYRSRLSNLKSQISNLATPTTPSPIPAWSEYSNKDFSFTYPGSWGPIQKTPTGCGSVESITDSNQMYEITVTTKCNYNTATAKPYASLEDYLKESPLKISYITIDSVKVAKITSYLSSSKAATEIVFLAPSKVIYSVSLARFAISENSSPLPDSVLQVFDHILSFLKFIKSGQ